MNQELFFWNRWLPAYRRLYIILLVLLGASVLIYLTQKYIGTDAIINWQVFNEVYDTSFIIDNFTKGIFNFNTDAPSFLVTEWFEASDMQINKTATYLYGGLLIVGLAWLLSVVTALPRWWYLGSMMVVIALLASFQVDILQVWGLTNSLALIIPLLLLLPVNYYFHAFRPDIPLVTRLLLFTLLTTTAAFVWLYFARVPHPAMSMLAYGTRVLALVTVLFVFIIAHEIPAHLLALITSTGITTGRNSIFHFTIISLFYVANLVVSYLYNSGLIEWNFLYLNGFYLLLISVILGIWGFRRRIGSFLSDPYGAMLYATLAVIALGTIGYAFATGNDPLTDMFEDVIIYSHLAMGLAFYIYIFINFRSPMAQGLPVHKIVYQPRVLPFGLSFALAGLIMLALLFRVNMLPFNQGVAGYHNYLGDVYFAEKNFILAESYYQKALLFQYRNHKSNYALATIARQYDNGEAQAAYLKQAITNKPTPHTYAALSQLYTQEDLFFEALFTLREGTRRFPKSGELFNNLALLYDKTRMLDSAYYFYEQAQQHINQPEVVHTNVLAFWARHFAPPQMDSVLAAAKPSDYHAYENNRLVISNILRKVDPYPYRPIRDSVLTREWFAYLYNYTLNHKKDPDTAVIADIKKLTRRPDNALFTDYLDFARSVYLYHHQQVAEAVELLKSTEQGTSEQQAAHLNKTLGMWYLQQGAPDLAAYRFEKARKAGDTASVFNQAFALTEKGDFGQAAPLWESIRTSPMSQFRSVANSMTNITQTLLGNQSANTLSDAEKVALVYYSRREDLTPVIMTIDDVSYRASALLYLAENHLRMHNVTAAQSDLQALQSLTVTDAGARQLIKELELKILWQKNNWSALAQAIATTSTPRKVFYQAEIAAHTNKGGAAEKYYRQAMQNLPFDEAIPLAAAQFYNQQRSPERAYEMLTTALQINPSAAEVQKAYVMQSLELNLTSYAAQGMETLRTMLPPADYQAFVPQYEAKRALVEKKLAAWE